MTALAGHDAGPVIDDWGVSVVYQPIVDVSTGALFAYEALARSPSFSPPSLFDAAVAHGHVGALGRTIREMASRDCEDHPLFFNVHPAELDEQYLVRFDDPVSRHGHEVFIEITESVPVSHVARCAAVLAELRARGIVIVVDDLGAGYSNLKYIADLEPRVVKIDRLLISGLEGATRQFQLVRAIITMCHDMDCLVVAEGIETPEELRAARLAGVDLGQGFLLGRPAFPVPGVSTMEGLDAGPPTTRWRPSQRTRARQTAG